MKKYITHQGDMWDSIAKKFFSREHYMHLLMEANPKYMQTVIFSAGVVLNIPEIIEEKRLENIPPWSR